MIFRPSSISSSEATAYLIQLFGTILFCLIIVGTVVKEAHQSGKENLPYQALLKWQLAKINSVESPQTVFLGDSSLGNAIDAAEWQQLSGQLTYNLALTGSFGYVGSYSLLRQVLQHGRPKNVIIFQTADMLTRDNSDESWLSFLDPAPNSLFDLLRYQWKLTFNMQELTLAAHWLGAKACCMILTCDSDLSHKTVIGNDYIKQGTPITLDPQVQGLKASNILIEKLNYLKKIADLCNQQNLNCLYAFGPLVQPICAASQEYFEKSSNLIVTTKLKLTMDSSVCIPVNEIGDSEDHVAPPFKTKYTKLYFQALKPFLVY